MAYKKEIEAEILEVGSLKALSEVYGQIAAIRMRKIRTSVLRNRNFISSIESIFKDALTAYAEKLSEMVKSGKIKEGGKVTFLAHNGKTVAVLVSANTGFFGEVVRETYQKFLTEVRNRDVEVTIIGKLGRFLFLED
jgi:F0F1-type ATP synthase gamma subunit